MLAGRRKYYKLLCAGLDSAVFQQYYKKVDATDLLYTLAEMAAIIHLEGAQYSYKLQCLASKIKICNAAPLPIVEHVEPLTLSILNNSLEQEIQLKIE